ILAPWWIRDACGRWRICRRARGTAEWKERGGVGVLASCGQARGPLTPGTGLKPARRSASDPNRTGSLCRSPRRPHTFLSADLRVWLPAEAGSSSADDGIRRTRYRVNRTLPWEAPTRIVSTLFTTRPANFSFLLTASIPG